MRLTKGSKVEVLSTKGLFRDSWIPAEIIGGNGHYYIAGYDPELPDVGVMIVGTIPRKFIRPFPPPTRRVGRWEPEDLIEMFDEGVWKPAKVFEVVGKGYFLVQLVGCSDLFKVHSSNLRTRKMWQNNKWRVMRKESGVGYLKNEAAAGNLSGRTKYHYRVMRRKMEVQSNDGGRSMFARSSSVEPEEIISEEHGGAECSSTCSYGESNSSNLVHPYSLVAFPIDGESDDAHSSAGSTIYGPAGM